jgi:hypothetical protein
MAKTKKASGVGTAFHEAGHAVMAWWLGIPLHRASIIPDKDRRGHILYTPSMPLKSKLPGIAKRWRLEAQIGMLVLAGLVAQRRLNTNFWIETSEEYGKAADLIASVYNPWRRGAKSRQWWLLQRVVGLTEGVLEEHWGTVTRIANALKKRHELSGEEIYTLIAEERGSPYRPGRSDSWIKIKNPAAPGEAGGCGGLGQQATATLS